MEVRRISVVCGLAATLLGTLCAPGAGASNPTGPGPADAAAAQTATVWRRVSPAHTPAGANLVRETPRAGIAASAAAAAAPDSGQTRYPADLTYLGGAVVNQAVSHPIYLTNPACNSPACWGHPDTFLEHFGASNMIHITDPYVGRSESSRYTVGPNVLLSHPLSPPLSDSVMLAVVHFVASQTQETGYGHIYHVFLPPGQDECIDAALTQCYSPDNPATFVFCAYHGSADFQDIGHVLYSVEPFQAVPGCVDKPGTPNGAVTDSTADALSHELFETITDPDGSGWWNTTNLNELGSEIGDECVFVVFVPSIFDPNAVVYGDPSIVQLAGKRYAIQPEYSNAGHSCATSPPED